MSLAFVDTSPSRHPRHLDIRQVIAELRRRNPRMGQERLAEALAARVEEDRRLLVDACTVLVRQVFTTAEIVRSRRDQDGRTPDERSQRRIAAKAEVKEIAARVRELAVLDMEIGGTKLRFMPAHAVAEHGGWLVKLADKAIERGGPDAMIGETITEQEAQQIRGTTA